VVRGAANNPAGKVEPLALTGAQQKAQSDLGYAGEGRAALIDVSVEYATAHTKVARTSRGGGAA